MIHKKLMKWYVVNDLNKYCSILPYIDQSANNYHLDATGYKNFWTIKQINDTCYTMTPVCRWVLSSPLIYYHACQEN